MSATIQSIDYPALLPALITGAGALAVLVADLFLEGARKRLLPGAAALVLIGALAAEAALWASRTAGQPRQTLCAPGSSTLCSYSVDNLSLTLQTLVLGATLLVVLMAPGRFKVPFGEYHFLLLSSATGAVVLAAARDFISLTVALETVSLPAFALVGFGRRAGGEAALKFFLMSVASTAVMLFGVSLVYGATGSVYFSAVERAYAAPGRSAQVLGVAAVLTLVGFAFKVSAVPFHFWTPEVYAGAPVPVAAYLSVVSKTAGFAGLILAAQFAFRPYLGSIGLLLGVLAALTMTVGNVVALRQRDVVRLLAWSTVAQAGYVLVPLAVSEIGGSRLGASPVGSADALGTAAAASVAYLVLYAVMNLGAFAVVSALTGAPSGSSAVGDTTELARYRGLYREHPRSALSLAFFLICLAGLPPGVMGLFAKVAVFKAAVAGGLVWLAAIMAVNVVIALYYYLRWAGLLFSGAAGAAAAPALAPTPASGSGPLPALAAEPLSARSARVRLPLGPRIAVGAALLLAVVFSVWPNPALDALTLR